MPKNLIISTRLFKFILFSALVLPSCSLFAQNTSLNKKILAIEAYKKYKIMGSDNPDDLKELGTEQTKIIRMFDYKRKKRGMEKVEETSITDDITTKRTYYFDENIKLFAIVELVGEEGVSKKLTYYFDKGKLTQAIDGDNNVVTDTIDKKGLLLWVRRMFSKALADDQ